ncbi:MAG: GGDEF domain-containing protein [Gammaproteobacteria bacterium]|nr:GGDEF domain-containing protein [Gammaproteobacteria bacterium]
MRTWISIRNSRKIIAEYTLYLILSWVVLLYLGHLAFGYWELYDEALILLILIPVSLFVSKRYAIGYLNNILALMFMFGFLSYSIIHSFYATWINLIIVISPVLFFLLSNILIGSLLSMFVLIVYFVVAQMSIDQLKPDEFQLFLQTIVIFTSVWFVSVLYERDWLSVESRLLVNSDIDFLTQIYNQRGLKRMLQKCMADSTRYHHSMGIIMFEIDSLADINRKYGYTTGDRVLIEVSELLLRHIRGGDSMGRWSNGKFMILAPNTGSDGAEQLAEKMRRLISAYFFEEVGHVDASFGVVPLQHESIDELIHKAEQMLRLARDNQTRIQVYSDDTA